MLLKTHVVSIVCGPVLICLSICVSFVASKQKQWSETVHVVLRIRTPECKGPQPSCRKEYRTARADNTVSTLHTPPVTHPTPYQKRQSCQWPANAFCCRSDHKPPRSVLNIVALPMLPRCPLYIYRSLPVLPMPVRPVKFFGTSLHGTTASALKLHQF